MWTERHRARHEARLKQMVSRCAAREVAGWLERADPPRSKAATPTLPVVLAIAWHLRVGGGWRALPPGMPPWRTVYGWFRRWLALGLFDRLLRDLAHLRRRAAGRGPKPRLAIIDTQTVKCIPVRGPRGYDAAKRVLGRKRVALVDAEGNWLAIAVVPASTQDRDTLPALDVGKAAWQECRATGRMAGARQERMAGRVGRRAGVARP
jgi:putative transposase